jgi:hypothetical protein
VKCKFSDYSELHLGLLRFWTSSAVSFSKKYLFMNSNCLSGGAFLSRSTAFVGYYQIGETGVSCYTGLVVKFKL